MKYKSGSYRVAIGIRLILGVLCFIVYGMALADPAGDQSNLTVQLQASADAEQLTVTVRNDGPDAIQILSWDTPFESVLSSDVFRFDGAKLPFLGRRVKRAEPRATDYLTLPAGGRLSATVALAAYYEIPIHQEYSVQYVGEIHSKTVAADPAIALDAGQWVTTDAVLQALAPAPAIAFARTPEFSSCSATRQTLLNEALDAAEQITLQARDALVQLPESLRPEAPRYLQWFGSYSEQRYQFVTDTYNAASSVMANETIEFNCDCTESAFAFVFPNRPFEIFLCNAFWTANVLGTDSRAGTIVHELSHFPAVQGTSDHAYGQTAASALARSDPGLAVTNADSIEYFAENTPQIPMQGELPQVPLDQYTSLAANVPVTDTVSQGQRLFYLAEGVRSIDLLTVNGDADLFVFSDPNRTNPVCESRLLDALDSCPVDSANRVFIAVEGFETSSFELTAVGEPNVTPQGGGDSDQQNPSNDADNSDANNLDQDAEVDSGGGGAGGWSLLLAALAGLIRRKGRAAGQSA